MGIGGMVSTAPNQADEAEADNVEGKVHMCVGKCTMLHLKVSFHLVFEVDFAFKVEVDFNP
jgi:hypothetical protein